MALERALLRQGLMFVPIGVSPQPFQWDADSGDRLLEMYHIMAVVSRFNTDFNA